MTPIAQWLNSALFGFDRAILNFYHELAVVADPVCRPIAKFAAIAGDNAMIFIALALILLLFAKTRKSGIGMITSLAFAFILTNSVVKPLVSRPRPFRSGVAEFAQWWEFVGATDAGQHSFPSTHATLAASAMFALCLCLCFFNGKENNRRYRPVLIPAAICLVLFAASRNYLMVHYPTDVIGGIITGAVAAAIGFLIVHLIYKLMERKTECRVCSWIVNADVRHLFKKKSSRTENE